MAKSKNITDKTKRILELYHLFITCNEVSKEEIKWGVCGKWNEETDEWEHWNDKTISRDIAILKHAGVPIRYSGKRNAYITLDKSESKLHKKENRQSSKAKLQKGELRYIEKIKRLTGLMRRLRNLSEDEPCEVHYKEMYPGVSKRTMQRDFSELWEIDYMVKYKREWESKPEERSYEWDGEIVCEYEAPIGHYYLMVDELPDPYL